MNGPVVKFASDVIIDAGQITVAMSTEAKDRQGDICTLDDWSLDNFVKAPRLMACHDYDSLLKQIGRWENVHVSAAHKALVGNPVYYTDEGNAEADWAYKLALKHDATYSVGFNPLDEPQSIKGGYLYRRKELLECSHVPIPANQEALQLALTKALRSRLGIADGQAQRRSGRPVQKWQSQFMDPEADGNTYNPSIHCIVAGCDDACQTTVPICSEHLRYLMASPAEPPGSPPDDDSSPMQYLRMVARHFGHMSVVKAGKVLSGANLGQLHSAMTALGKVHDAACDQDDCPLDDDGENEPPTQADKGVNRAMGEGSGAAGGFAAASDNATPGHGAVSGTHTHAHTAAGDQGGDDTHSHEHDHQGDANHSGAEHVADHKSLVPVFTRAAKFSASDISSLPDSAFAIVDSGGTKKDGITTPLSLRHLPHHNADGSIDLPHLRNALARVSQTDLSADDKAKAEAHLDAHAKAEKIGDYADDGDTGKAFSSALEDAMTKALEAVDW